MSAVLTAVTVVATAAAGYAWGRCARSRGASASMPVPAATAEALADVERRVSRLERDRAAARAVPARSVTPSPVLSPALAGGVPSGAGRGVTSGGAGWAVMPAGPGVPAAPAPRRDELALFRVAPRRRSPLEARRHYEALADEVARERRLAEFEARATGTDSTRVVALPARAAHGERVRRYRSGQ